MSKPTLTCWGGVGTVTGANFLLEINNKKILVDCGLLQGLPSVENTNAEKFDYDPASIDYLFITHAHIDHIGKVPKLVRDGFKGVIYSTAETRDIATLMLADMVKISSTLYDLQDVEKSLSLWQALNYHEVKDFGEFKLELFNAGHILGSAMLKLTLPSGKSVLFTGDLGNSPSPLLPITENVSGLSYLLMDSVYGDRNHEDKLERDRKFKSLILNLIEKKGTLIIPIFSLERTQVILYELNKMFETGEVSQIPVFLDSPLAIRVTEIYERASKLYNQTAQGEIRGGDDIFKFSNLRETAQVRDSQEIIHTPGPKIILAGSGMSTAGRILGHEETYLPDAGATILFVGYQAPGTLGRTIQEGAKQVTIDNHEVIVRAKVETIDGYSAHADSNALVDFVSHTASTLKQAFITMGEPRSSIFLAQRLNDELNVKAIVPERGKRYELDL
ncbi:MAG: MBL fold metallo-hydrolase [Minisyncoccota bacterium]